MKTTVREAIGQDFENVLALLGQLWPSRKLDSVSLAQVFKRMLAQPDFFAYCSVSDNSINGFVLGYFVESLYYNGLLCQMCCLVVDQEARGKGIGTLLMDAVKHLAHKKGCGAIELESAVRRREAHAFYTKYGFERRAFCFSMNL